MHTQDYLALLVNGGHGRIERPYECTYISLGRLSCTISTHNHSDWPFYGPGKQKFENPDLYTPACSSIDDGADMTLYRRKDASETNGRTLMGSTQKG